ncbi:transmembrane channel-like protein 3 [Littorina saxatilis]|uniref:transmembrane channel-like protein 3 n=2 Tax=Littorina saxatilis TaxID=31220 RepID=UPI0038B63CF5
MDESHPLLTNTQGQGSLRAAPSAPDYQAFDNQGLVLETDLTETNTLPSDDRDDRGVDIGTVPGGAQQADISTAACEADTVSIVTIGEEQEKVALGGEEILFRLRLAHIYGDLDWANHLRRLNDKSREDVHVQILDKLREQPISIHQKIRLSRYLRDRMDTTSVSSLTSQQARKRQKSRRSKFKPSVGIWNGNIGTISAYFGSHVASYFVFLKFLVYLDVLMALLLFGLVTLPQILSNNNAAPEGLSGDFGVVSTSVIFFGAYSDTKWGFYDRPLAFFLTWAAVNVLCFLVIVSSMYIRYSLSKRVETSEDEFPFSTTVFSSWDHALTKPEGAGLRTNVIITNTKEMVREERSPDKSTCCQSTGQFVIRAVVNMLVVAVLGGSGYLIYLVADTWDSSLDIPRWLDDLLRTYKLPLVVAALKMFVPLIFDQVIRLEGYAPRTELKVTIARTALFYLASLVVFLLSMYEVSTQCIRDVNVTASTATKNRAVCCWENEVGEEVVKVVLIDLGQILLTTLLFDFLRAAVIKCGAFTSLGYREFTVASEVLDVIYGQSLVWLGLFFSPLLAAMGVVKLVIVFYFRYVTARMCKVPPRTFFRASRSGNFFMFILLINFFVCFFTMAYAVIELKPSTDCGPFKAEDHVFEILTSRVGDLPTWIRDVIVYVSTPAIVIPVILFLLLGVLYFKAKSASYTRVIDKLREQLRFERRVEKREVFARARIIYAGPQVSGTGSSPRQRQMTTVSSRTSITDTATTSSLSHP